MEYYEVSILSQELDFKNRKEKASILEARENVSKQPICNNLVTENLS